jgi:hypothetical protein
MAVRYRQPDKNPSEQYNIHLTLSLTSATFKLQDRCDNPVFEFEIACLD